tara:strand:- start:176 stop:526 length:351 start_codon:yes stop_codon:yes gene_type:complete
MNNINNKIIAYLGRTPNFETEVKLMDDFVGGVSKPYIAEWNAKDKAKPTDSQLNALESEATKLKNNNLIRITRKKSYGSIGDQLDLLYKDMIAGKGDSTGEWFKSVKKVKDDNPKE